MPTRQSSVSRCGAAVDRRRRVAGRLRMTSTPPVARATRLRAALSKRTKADERRERGGGAAPIPAVLAVVPGEPDRLRAPARAGDAEPEAAARAVEEARRERQTA